MDFILDLLQGLGIAAAIGIRPFLPVLLVGALASANAGIDFEGTDFAFLEQAGFLLAMIVGVAALGFIDRRKPAAAAAPPLLYVALVIALVLGALLAAGSIADRSDDWWPGVIVGPLAAALGFFAALSLFGRVRARLDAEAQGALPLYGEAAALLAAGLSVLFPPLALVVVGVLAWLYAGGRRRAGEKYAGLRILK
jgi:Na+-translocating ferredoxin:NAD+ oxidoreductase RnfA subunit